MEALAFGVESTLKRHSKFQRAGHSERNQFVSEIVAGVESGARQPIHLCNNNLALPQGQTKNTSFCKPNQAETKVQMNKPNQAETNAQINQSGLPDEAPLFNNKTQSQGAQNSVNLSNSLQTCADLANSQQLESYRRLVSKPERPPRAIDSKHIAPTRSIQNSMNLSNSQQACAGLGNGMQLELYRRLVPKPGRPRAHPTTRIRALHQSKHNVVTRIRLNVIHRRVIRKASRISQEVSKPGHATELKVMSPFYTGEPQVPKPKPRLFKPELLAQDHPLLGNKETVLKYLSSQNLQNNGQFVS